MTDLFPDIRRGPTWTAEHLRACLARWVAAQPQKARRGFFATWELRHGRESAAKLHQESKAEYRKLKERGNG